MNLRRKFIKSSLQYGVTFFAIPAFARNLGEIPKHPHGGDYRLALDVPTKLFDGESCWVHPRVGIVPNAGTDGVPRAVMTMNTLALSGSDVFKGMFGLYTDNVGKTWTEPQQINNLNPRFELIDNVERPVAASDFWPRYHAASKTLLGTGHTVVYTPDWKVTNPRPRHSSYSIYNPKDNNWSLWQKLEMPQQDKFNNAGAGCVQRYDEADGSILLPIYFSPPNTSSHVTVVRCAFNGQTLQYQEHGNELSIDGNTRGLHEPSLTRYNDEYFLTIRNDLDGYVTKSKDGLHYEAIRSWKFDDGTDLGNYNTQQHWVAHSDALFLVYTRRGANNDHVFRHRAPLFMAQVDPKRLCVIRSTEKILVPERGARLGNFGVTEISKHETWVTVSEWMQPKGAEKYGSDGSVYVARINWDQPNLLFKG